MTTTQPLTQTEVRAAILTRQWLAAMVALTEAAALHAPTVRRWSYGRRYRLVAVHRSWLRLYEHLPTERGAWLVAEFRDGLLSGYLDGANYDRQRTSEPLLKIAAHLATCGAEPEYE